MRIGVLRQLSPFGPIFGKELRVSARRKRTYILRSVYLAVLLLILAVTYASMRHRYSYGGAYGSVAAQNQRQADLATRFFASFTMFGLFSMAAVGAVLTSTAISSERKQKTLNVLLMTPITAWQIIAGKLFSRLLVAVTLIGLSLPVLGVVRLLGSVEVAQMARVLVLWWAAAIFSAALGLFFSTFMSRAYAAILLSYGVLILLYGLIPALLAWLIEPRGRVPEAAFVSFIASFNPFLCGAGEIERRAPFGRDLAWWCLGTHLVMTAALVLCSAAVLRRISRKAGGAGGGEKAETPMLAAPALSPAAWDSQPSAAASGPAVLYAGGPAALVPLPPSRPVRTRRRHDVWDNPVLWRESRQPLFLKRWQRIVAAILVVLTFSITYLSLACGHDQNDLTDPENQVGFAWIAQLLLLLLLVVISATGIVQEKENDTWTLLLATPLTARAIVWAKFVGTLRKLKWPALFIIGHFVAFAFFGVITWSSAAAVLWILFTFSVVWAASGLFFSVRVKRVTVAVILNLLLALAFYLLPAFLLSLYDGMASASDDHGRYIYWYVPFHYLETAVDALSRNREFMLPSTDRYSYSPTRFLTRELDEQKWLTAVIGAGFGYMALTWGILECTIAGFNRWMGRASQRAS